MDAHSPFLGEHLSLQASQMCLDLIPKGSRVELQATLHYDKNWIRRILMDNSNKKNNGNVCEIRGPYE